jgi:hypothetical protein
MNYIQTYESFLDVPVKLLLIRINIIVSNFY